jgi:hypothetical protein
VLLIEAFKFVPNAIACELSVIIAVTASKAAQLGGTPRRCTAAL